MSPTRPRAARSIRLLGRERLILARSRGIAVKLVAMVHYTPVMTTITRADAAMAKPSDLMGKKIASTHGDLVRVLAPALARINGFDSAKINLVTVD